MIKCEHTLSGLTTSRQAKDGRVDVVGHFPGTDTRKTPLLLMVGQVTCTASDNWEAKAKSVRASTYRNATTKHWDPFAFLAIPHHIDSHYRELIRDESERAIFDRLTLSLMLEEPNEDAQKIVEAVLAHTE